MAVGKAVESADERNHIFVHEKVDGHKKLLLDDRFKYKLEN
jgi:hypothetical protein